MILLLLNFVQQLLLDQNWLWALLAATGAVFLETVFRRYPSISWFQLLPIMIPVQLVISFGILNLVRRSESLLTAFVVFTCGTLGLRIVATAWLGDPIPPGVWLSLVFILLARTSQVAWR